MNKKMIFHTLGWVLLIEGICMILPLICGMIYREREVLSFAYTIGLIAIVGFILIKLPLKSKSLFAKEGLIIVALSWILMSLAGCIPFIISGYIPSFTDALFETVSGFTTTGASILTDVEALPKSLLFWRSFTHWIGGMGVLVFLLAILPMSGANNMHLMRAESPGPSVSKLVPRIRSTAKILYAIYSALTIIEIIFLLAGGMSLFESILHAFGTAGTGGFGIKNNSIEGYSPYLQNVITVFMMLFGVNFSIYYLALTKHFKEILKSTELKTYLGLFAIASIFICANILPQVSGITEALRLSCFQVATVMTTTGYSTCNFDLWPTFSKTILVLLMFIGASAGSTGGGIKVSRILVVVKSIGKELRTMIHPKSVRKITVDGHVVEHETVRGINVFFAAYTCIFVFSLLIIALDNQSFTTSFTTVVSAINNIGPGLDAVGPAANFSILSPLSKFVMIFDMLAGRLEIFPMLVLFSTFTYKR